MPSTGNCDLLRGDGVVVVAEDDAAPVAGEGVRVGVVVGGAADAGVVVRGEGDRVGRGAQGLEGTALVLDEQRRVLRA